MPTYEIDILTGTDDNVVHPSPCVVSPTAEAAFTMTGTSDADFVSEPPGEMSFEGNWELLNRGIQSQAGSAVTFKSSYTNFSLLDFDGDVEFYCEVIAFNGHATNSYNIYLVDATNGTVLVTIPVSANSGNTFITTGNIASSLISTVLAVKLDQTASNDQLGCWTFRLRFIQTNPTKTCLQFHITTLDHSISSQDLVIGDNRFLLGGDTGFGAESGSSYFKKSLGSWEADTVTWVLEVMAGNTAIIGTATATFALWDLDLNAEVMATDHTIGGSNTELKTDSIDDSLMHATNRMALYSRNVCSWASNTLLLSAKLFVKLTGGISEATVTRPISSNFPQYITADSFQATSGIVYNLQATGSGSAGKNIFLKWSNSLDMSGPTTVISTLYEGSKEVKNSAALSLASGQKYYAVGVDTGATYSGGYLFITLTK